MQCESQVPVGDGSHRGKTLPLGENVVIGGWFRSCGLVFINFQP